MTTRWERIARANNGEEYAAAYAERFRTLAAQGEDIHGEAAFVQRLLDPPAPTLDWRRADLATMDLGVAFDDGGYVITVHRRPEGDVS